MQTNPLSVVDIERMAIAAEVVRRCDTVAILTTTEVEDIYKRALAGEFDGIFEDEL